MARRIISLTLLLLLSLPLGAQALSPVDEGTVKVDGASLAYRVYGSGEPLLLITGYTVTMETWPEPFLEMLSRERQVIIFDNRDMARSKPAPMPSGGAVGEPLSIPGMAEDSAAVLHGLGIGRAAVLGWSMGGCIAQELALAHPELVGKLVLYATDIENDGVLEALARIEAQQASPSARPAGHLFPDAWMDVHPDYLSVFPPVTVPPEGAAIARQKQAIADWKGVRERLSELRMPVLFVVGEEDVVTPAERTRLAASLVGGPVWLAVFENAGHGLVFQSPTDMARVVLTFLGTAQRVE